MKFLKENVNVFAWSHDEMLGIESDVMMHYLNVDLNYKPIQQKKCVFTPKRYEAIRVEVEKLKHA